METVFGLCKLLTACGNYVCSQRSRLVRVQCVCFHDKIWSEVNLNISSRSKKQMTFSRQKIWWDMGEHNYFKLWPRGYKTFYAPKGTLGGI